MRCLRVGGQAEPVAQGVKFRILTKSHRGWPEKLGRAGAYFGGKGPGEDQLRERGW